MKLQEKLQALSAEHKAILAVNFYNYETLTGVLRAFAQTGNPVILQASESTIRYLGVRMAVSTALLRNSTSLRVASIADHSISSQKLLA